MRPSYPHWLCVISFALSCSAGAATPDWRDVSPDSRDAAAGICVHVYNYAEVPPKRMTRALDDAANVLARAGIETRWLDVLAARWNLSLAEKAGDTELAGRLDQMHFIVNVAPQTMARKYQRHFGLSASHFGFAVVPPNNEGFGNLAIVFLDPVMLLAEMAKVSEGLVLGYAIAHEIGHLLLGRGSHSPSGIMKASWGNRELHRAATGMLFFTVSESRRMRQAVQARERTQESADVNPSRAFQTGSEH